MQQAVRGQGLAAIEFKGRSIKARYLAPSLLNDQNAGRRIPGIEIELPEAVVTSRGHIAQIERRRARTAHAMGMQRDLVIEVNVRILVPLVAGKTGGQQAFFQRGGFRDVNWFAVQPRASSLLVP